MLARSCSRKRNMRRQSCCAMKGPGSRLAFLRRWEGLLRIRCCNKTNGFLFLHVFALFRLIEDAATCVWGSLATRIVAKVAPFFPHPLHPPFSPERYAWCQPTTSPIHMVESDKSASYAAEPSGKPPRPADVVAAILRNSKRGFTFSRRRRSCMHARGPANRALCTCVIYVIVANKSRSYTSTTLVLSRAFIFTRHCGLTKFCHSPRVSSLRTWRPS